MSTAGTGIEITQADMIDAVERAADGVGFKHRGVTVTIAGKRVVIEFVGALSFSAEVNEVRTIDNLAKIAVIRALHELEKK